ncbi:uncharacterized protein LOC120637442 isoform X1 [Pararge aegeria]|uniref:uncharacterized protein LOC120637442 isoform X1 n=1 Tax=Pararge aegeria TaxID=116150 RepID=UPI0019D2F68C|nr:uncharacterized protein LOC120637442 isoform X1 [Pararge aegeria]
MRVMNGDVQGEAPRPRPLSAGIWTLFSWLRRTDRSSSSESVSSVGSDRTVASFDFLAPLNYKNTNTPLVLPSCPLTDTYKQRLHERNLRRQHDRDITLRRKYGLFREEGLGYDAFSLPAARRIQKDTVLRQDRGRRATSESTRRSAYVPGKRRAPLPPTVVISATLPRTYKRKRPAPKPPAKVSEENKENVQISNIMQMNSTAEISKNARSKDITITTANKTEKHSKLEIKEIKLRTDKSFLKQIFESKKRNSAIDSSRIKYLPSISELDKQAAEIIEANKALRASEQSDSFMGNGSRSTEETWICTTCLRKYKPVVTCCIYCVIQESSNNNKNRKSVPNNASNTCTQTDENGLKSNRENGNDDKKKLREMLKEMKDSLPKRPKHNKKYPGDDRVAIVKPTETPTLRIGSTIDDKVKGSFINTNTLEDKRGLLDFKNKAKESFLTSQPSSSKDFPISDTSKVAYPPYFIASGNTSHNISTSQVQVQSIKESLEGKKLLKSNNPKINSAVNNKKPGEFLNANLKVTNAIPDLGNINKCDSSTPKNDKNIHEKKEDTSSGFNGVAKQTFKDSKEISTVNLIPLAINCTIFEKEAELPKKDEYINASKISDQRNSNQTTVLQFKKCDTAASGTKDNIERIQLGNVFSSKVANINDTEHAITSNNTRNTPLKISSLLNPLYSPKYKATNDKVADCNLGNVLITPATKMESNKKEKTSVNQPKIQQTNTVSTTINVQSPSTSNTKLLHEAIQKSDASTEKTPRVKILDHHDRRRNLINQLEQAISKGDEQLAADAAAKLAKLKLACSVLSFSSQIIAEAILNKTEILEDDIASEENNVHQNSASNIRVDSLEVQEKVIKDKEKQVNQKPTSTVRKEINISSEASTSTSSQIANDEIPIEVWIEDIEAARGPIPLYISRKARMGKLKRQVETSLGLAIPLQRWIVGRTLCIDDNTPLVALAGPDLKAPFYLCLVESETNKDNSPLKDTKVELNEINNTTSGEFYTELIKLEQQAFVPNAEQFECGVCIEKCAVGAGVVLRECIHTFCRECLVDVIRHCEEPVVACPAIQCPGALQEREIRAILTTEEYERWLARGLAAAESGTRNTFHCRTHDCKGWAFCEPGARRFPCPVCKYTNCVPCQAVHEGETCEQYQVKLRNAVSDAESNQNDEGTQALLKSLISRGEALECPECSAIITKKWGCDWIKCSACKTEICWVTRGRRWGPGGKGDTSGGCRCGVDGKRCHPSCGYCH